MLCPQRGVNQRQVGASKPGHGSAEGNGGVADGNYGIADGMGRLVRIADGAQDHAPAGVFQKPVGEAKYQDADINQRVVTKQQAPHDRQIRQHGDIDRPYLFNGLANIIKPDQC